MAHFLVGNSTAQSGRAAEHIERARRFLEEKDVDVRVLSTEPNGRTVKLVERAVNAERPEVVISFGGDGTFNEVARGLLAANHPAKLGMLPMGTANNQGRSFGLEAGPDAIETNIEVILAGYVTQLDVGRIERLDARLEANESTLFFDSVGWGMQPEILKRRNKDREAIAEIPIVRDVWRDQAVYAGATIKKLLESYVAPVKFNATIVSDGESHRYDGLTDLVISNTALYAGEWVTDRSSEPDDGLFELVPFQGRRDWLSKTIRDLAKLDIRQEDLDNLGITHSVGYRAADFDVELVRLARDEIAAQVDGEEWHAGYHFRVRVADDKLPLITPEGFAPPWR